MKEWKRLYSKVFQDIVNVCPECGLEAVVATPYCPMCGEELERNKEDRSDYSKYYK